MRMLEVFVLKFKTISEIHVPVLVQKACVVHSLTSATPSFTVCYNLYCFPENNMKLKLQLQQRPRRRRRQHQVASRRRQQQQAPQQVKKQVRPKHRRHPVMQVLQIKQAEVFHQHLFRRRQWQARVTSNRLLRAKTRRRKKRSRQLRAKKIKKIKTRP